MFSWICTRCGQDNRPSAVVCQRCGVPFDAPEEEVKAPVPEPVPPPIPQAVLPPDPEPIPVRPAPVPRLPSPPRPAAPVSSGLPTWLLTIVFFFAIAGIGLGIYYGITYFGNRKAAVSTGLDPAANVARTKTTSPLQKVVEVVGIRMMLDSKRKPEARFVVVNHSSNELDGLAGTVTIWASTSRSEEDSVGTFTFKIGSLGSYESKEMSAPFNTKLKIYELPDWQNATPDVQFTSE
jgi:hypothetical protein